MSASTYPELVGGCPWGAAPGALWAFPGRAPPKQQETKEQGLEEYRSLGPHAHTRSPASTGSSVLAVKFGGGVVMAADTLASYGSLARFKDCPRLVRLGEGMALGASGDYADFQYLRQIIERKVTEQTCLEDGMPLKPRALYSWLTRVLYNRRSKFDPLWNTFVVAGMQDGEPFLGAIDKIGTAYEDVCIGTGFAAHLAIPLLREYTDKKVELDEAAAIELVKKCMNVLYYRDARSFYMYQMAVVNKDGTTIHDNLKVEQNWNVAHLIHEY